MGLYEQLASRGIAVTDDRLSAAQVADVHDYLRDKRLWVGGHWTAYARPSDVTTERFMADPDYAVAFACYAPEVAWGAPHLADKAREYVALARGYFRAAPSIFSVNIFWSFPGGPVSPQIQEWHRDACSFDDKQLAMFIYLTDVNGDGAHCYRTDDGDEVAVAGPAGTIFVEDPTGMHRGRKPTLGCRLMAWARYGIMAPEQTLGMQWSRGLRS